MLYLLQVIFYTLAMLLIYMLFLRNRPLYQFSRYYLLASAVMPLLIPLIKLPVSARQEVQHFAAMKFNLEAITINANHEISGTGKYMTAIWAIYIGIVVLIIAWQLWNGYRLLQIIKRNEKEDRGFYSVIIAPGYGPGSFGRYIFFPGEEINETVLAHEQAHIQLHHTLDIMLLSVLQAFAWPNLFLIWIRKELKEIHEFQADATADTDKEKYAQLLLCSVFCTKYFPVMHSFNIHPIKRRIMMLYKNGKASPLKAGLQVTASLCLFLATAIAIQSCSKKTASPGNKPEIVAAAKNQTPVNGDSVNGKKIYNYLDKMPEAPYDLKKFITENIRYPRSAREKGIEGRVIVKFIVDENGNVLDPVIMHSPDQSLSDETIRVINMMPKWIPGENNGKREPVYFLLPVVFKMKN